MSPKRARDACHRQGGSDRAGRSTRTLETERPQIRSSKEHRPAGSGRALPRKRWRARLRPRDPAFSPGAACRSLVVLVRKPLTLPADSGGARPDRASSSPRPCRATECQLHSGALIDRGRSTSENPGLRAMRNRLVGFIVLCGLGSSAVAFAWPRQVSSRVAHYEYVAAVGSLYVYNIDNRSSLVGRFSLPGGQRDSRYRRKCCTRDAVRQLRRLSPGPRASVGVQPLPAEDHV